MANIHTRREALIARILEGEGRASPAQRKAAFLNAPLGEPLDTLIQKVAQDAHAVSDQDVEKVLAAGLDEDQAFELTVCAAVGAATRQYDLALAALELATSER